MPRKAIFKTAFCGMALTFLSACATVQETPSEEPQVATHQISLPESTGPASKRNPAICRTGKAIGVLYVVSQNPDVAATLVADWLEKRDKK